MERRQHPRLVGAFNGRWEAASGGGPCVVGDISLGGCFAHCLEAPVVGEPVVVILDGDGPRRATRLEGRVVDVTSDPMARSEWEQGFSVAFQPLTASQESGLKGLMASLRHRRRSA